MTLTLTLTPDIEKALKEKADDRGTTPELLALDSLRDQFVADRAKEAPPQTASSLWSLLEGHLGKLRSSEHVPGGARMSEDPGRKFATALAVKRQHKHL